MPNIWPRRLEKRHRRNAWRILTPEIATKISETYILDLAIRRDREFVPVNNFLSLQSQCLGQEGCTDPAADRHCETPKLLTSLPSPNLGRSAHFFSLLICLALLRTETDRSQIMYLPPCSLIAIVVLLNQMQITDRAFLQPALDLGRSALSKPLITKLAISDSGTFSSRGKRRVRHSPSASIVYNVIYREN